MKTILSICILICFGTLVFAQNMVKQKRELPNFSQIRVSSGLEVYLNQSPNQSVLVVGPTEKVEKVRSEVKGNTLSLYVDYENGWSWGKKSSSAPIKVYLSVEDLNEINVSGGASVESTDDLLLNELNLNVSGGADVKLTMNAKKVQSNVSGGADVTLTGTAKTLRANTSGGADFHGKNFKVGTAQVNCSGGADSAVWAIEYLQANASGGADIYYYGTPKKLEKNESSSASVSPR
jgi:hypothetical protein